MARLKIVAPLFSRRSRDTDSIRRVFYYSNYLATCLVKTPMINPGRWRFPLVSKVRRSRADSLLTKTIVGGLDYLLKRSVAVALIVMVVAFLKVDAVKKQGR